MGCCNFNLLKNLSETIEKHNLKITINLLIIDKYFKDIHGGISYGKIFKMVILIIHADYPKIL